MFVRRDEYDGRTSLLYAFCWGIMRVLLIKNIYPLISRYVEKIPRKPGVAITWILLVFMILDLAISAIAGFGRGGNMNCK